MRNFITVTVLVMIIAILRGTAISQEPEKVVLPDPIMQEVVSRIVRWYYKPAKRPRTVQVWASTVKPDWMPSIHNLTFELVRDYAEVRNLNKVFFVKDIEQVNGFYEIEIGWGDKECEATGDYWRFRPSNDGVRLWMFGTGWGMGCGRSSDLP